MSETRTVVFHYEDTLGNPVTSGRVSFTPIVPLVSSSTDTLITLGSVVGELDALGDGSVVLTCTDDPSITPTGWVWAVQEHFTGGRQGDNAYFVELPSTSPATVSLADLTGVVPTIPGSGSAPAAGGKFTTLLGDGAQTSFVVMHLLGTKDVSVTCFEASGTFEEVIPDVEHTSADTVTVRFATAPTSGQYRLVVQS